MAGGDYHDVFTLGQNRLALLISDASGHGMKACMSIMVMHALVQLLRDQRHQNTAEFVAAVNRRMCESDIVRDEGGFITLLYCILDTSKHTMEWTSAGHPVAMLHDLAANQVIQIEDSDAVGLPLGIAADVTYEACSTTLPENCRLLLYTDGLAEAFPVDRGERQQFGRAGIVFTLRATAKLPVRDALDMLFVASSAFAGGNGRQDDTSAILVERTSGATPPVPATELSKKGQTRIYT
jgi:serine phosphatase RsbU (regulator of sigma subunit)